MGYRAEWYPVWRCVVLKDGGGVGLSRFSGGFSEGETPLPIPNRAVKPLSADGTWLERAWESRTPPVYFRRRAGRRSAAEGARRSAFRVSWADRGGGKSRPLSGSDR